MFLLLLILWIIFNGKFTIEILLFGVIISAVICLFLVRFADYPIRREKDILRILPQLLVYLAVLLREIFCANIAVLKLVYGRKYVEPAICHFHTTISSSFLRTLLANSITLTPGTITVSLHDDELYVHCLDKSLAEGMNTSVFIKRLERMDKCL